ncbi:hypothetical protein [Trinickia terrae]|uniref:hypothetical protein n=1 Tax=Trinickia terrae TaxID=2571161 RepID=UPI0010AE9190|nr:hypothetical protein [Trinickia terrae]
MTIHRSRGEYESRQMQACEPMNALSKFHGTPIEAMQSTAIGFFYERIRKHRIGLPCEASLTIRFQLALSGRAKGTSARPAKTQNEFDNK